MTSLGNLTVGIGLDTSGLVSGFALARQHIQGFAGIAAGLLAGTAVATAGVGIAAVKMAGDFSQSMTSLVTGAGESQKNIKMVSDGILTLATATGTSTKQLADGMYMIESAGYHGAVGLAILKAAAEGAKVGNADLASVANGVTTAMTDYATSHLTATQATNDLIATVASGKTHMQDLSNALSTILPVSSKVGVSFTDTSAALATMTGEGTDAASASTYLRQLLLALEAPAKKGADALASIGLSSQQVSNEMKVSLPGALEMITDHLKKKFPEGSAAYVEALKNIAGGSRQMQGILELTGSHLDVLKSNLTTITDAVKKGGDSITGWNLVQQDFNFKVDKAREMVETLGIKIGTVLLPVAGSLFDKVSPLIQNFSDWVGQGNNLQGVLSTVGGVLQDDVLHPIEQLYNAIEPIVTDFITWNDKTHFLQNTLSDVGQLIKEVADDVSSNLVPPIRSLLSNLEQWLSKSNAVHDALGILGTVVDKTSGLVGTLIGWIADLVGWFAQSEPRANALKDVLFGIGGIIATMKIVEFGQNVYSMGMQAKDAATHFLDLAGTIKDKLVDAFNSLTGKARDAGTAVENVGTRAKTAESNVKTAATESETDIEGIGAAAEATGARVDSTIDKSMAEMSRMTREGAAKAEADIEGIGVAAQTTEGEVATASTEMEGELGIIGEEAVVASGEVSDIGTAAEDAEVITATASAGMKSSLGGVLGLLGLIGTVGIASFQAVKGNNPLSDIQKGDIGGLLGYLAGLTTGAGQLANGIDALQEGWGKAFGNMNTSASTNSTAIKNTVDTNFSSMKLDSLFTIQSFTDSAIANLKKLGDQGKNIMQSLDQNTISYWNDIAAYIDRKSANAAASANRNLSTIHAPRGIAMGPANTESDTSGGATPSHFATGGMAPGGSVLLGEFGPEWVDLPQGSIIHSTGSSGGGSGSSGGGPTTLILEIDGRQFAAATVDHIAPAVVNRMRLRVGTRV